MESFNAQLLSLSRDRMEEKEKACISFKSNFQCFWPKAKIKNTSLVCKLIIRKQQKITREFQPSFKN